MEIHIAFLVASHSDPEPGMDETTKLIYITTKGLNLDIYLLRTNS